MVVQVTSRRQLADTGGRTSITWEGGWRRPLRNTKKGRMEPAISAEATGERKKRKNKYAFQVGHLTKKLRPQKKHDGRIAVQTKQSMCN